MTKQNQTATIPVARWLRTLRRHLGTCVDCGHELRQHLDALCADCVKCTGFKS